MISRLMLSLKKASRGRVVGWTSNALSGSNVRTCTRMEFVSPSNGIEDSVVMTSNGAVLSDLSYIQTSTQIREKSGEEKV